MAIANDRVGELLEGTKRNRRTLVSPEGVPLDIRVAGHGERLAAFFIDIGIMLGVVIGLALLVDVLLPARGTSILKTLILFIAFIVRNGYFLHFELAWQGRTPGKKACGLRVINRAGGELTPAAVIARNLTREVEFFLPLGLYVSLDSSLGVWGQVSLVGWAAMLASLPLWGREHLRAGDLIGGTQVISLPKRVLLDDLTLPEERKTNAARYSFTHEQLAIYGAFELQVLEEFLRRPDTDNTKQLLQGVCGKICRKIGWNHPVPPGEVRRFLTDFYAAERAELELGQLFGRLREDKTQGKGGKSAASARKTLSETPEATNVGDGSKRGQFVQESGSNGEGE